MTDLGTANPDEFAAWNGESGHRWVASADRRDAVLAPIADRLLTAATIRPGERVLDLGCGCGATTLLAASAVGPTGSVLGLDLSEPMLDVAVDRARAADASTVTFVHADAQTHRADGEFDVAISRFGTMFFSDPTAAFANVADHLRPGGRLCLATWQPLVANEWLVVPGAALAPFVDDQDGSGGIDAMESDRAVPGMFAQSVPGTIISVLTAAGFDSVECAPWTATLTFGATVDDAVAYLADSGPGRAALAAVADDDRSAALAAAADALRTHDDGHGVHLEAATWITTARRG